jgi:putative DNA primase/helicase
MDNIIHSPALDTPGSSELQNKFNKRNYYNSKLIREIAYGRWPKILEALGINSVYLRNKHGGCPICREGKDRYRFDDKEGRGTWFCSKCGAGDGFRLLQLCHDWSFPYALEMVARFLGMQATNDNLFPPKHISYYLQNIQRTYQSVVLSQEVISQRRNNLRKVWQSARPVTIGDPVDCYLRSRGIELNVFPAALFFCPHLPYYEDKKLIGEFSAMLALVKDVGNQSVTMHRTYLGDCCKADVLSPKKLMPPITPISGAAIRLFEPVDATLAIAEGIENALAFSIATNIPSWAAISANGMERIILPAIVKNVVIAADNDLSGRGQRAAHVLSQRLIAEGCTVRRVIPQKVGFDFNNVLLEVSQ